MNGMQRKKQQREHAKQFTEDGLPRDANDWLVEDWATLFHAMEKVRKVISLRHRERKK